MALDLLHALIGPLSTTFIPVSFPSGHYEKFDQSEVESLGEGLIDLSGKELISALVEMNIFARLRFLLANPQTNSPAKLGSELWITLKKHSVDPFDPVLNILGSNFEKKPEN